MYIVCLFNTKSKRFHKTTNEQRFQHKNNVKMLYLARQILWDNVLTLDMDEAAAIPSVCSWLDRSASTFLVLRVGFLVALVTHSFSFSATRNLTIFGECVCSP